MASTELLRVYGEAMANWSSSIDDQLSEMTSGLLEEVGSRNASAWQRLVELYAPLVYLWCRNSGLEPDDAARVGGSVFQQVSKEVFRSVVKDLKVSFRDRLRDAAFREVKRFVARLSDTVEKADDTNSELVPTESTEGLAPDVHDVDFETFVVLERIINKVKAECSPAAWQSFRRVSVEKQSLGIVAEELGISKKEVLLGISQTSKRLRSELELLADS